LENRQVSGLFQITAVSAATMRCQHAESGKQYTISITPLVRSYAKPGMIVRGNIVKTDNSGSWRLIHVSHTGVSERGRAVYLS
jgi:hypothetical protein